MHDDFLRIGDFRSRQPEFARLSLPEGYVWSEDLRITQRDPWIALYRPLNLGLCYLHQSLLDGGELGSELSTNLKSEHLLIPPNSQMDSEEHKELVWQARKGTFRFICILPTTACELKCAYCHQLVKAERARRMTLEEIREGMTLAARLCTDESKPVDILIYGGEPLSAFDITEEVLKLTRPASGLFRQPVRVTFTTSGVGLIEEQADILAHHDVFVIVSIDGAPTANDFVRRADDGFSSYAHAERACQMLTARGCRVGLSVTIGKHNADDIESHVEHLIKKFRPRDIGLNAFLHRRGESVNPFQMDGKTALGAVLKGLEVCRRYGVYAEQPFRRLRPFVFRQPLLKDCSAPGERLVLAPGGVAGFCDSCYPDGQYFYDFDQFDAACNPNYQAWAGLSAPEMPECRWCPAMTVCGGACRYDAFKASGHLDGVDPLRCEFELGFLKWMIWDLFDRLSPQKPFVLPSSDDRKKLIEDIPLSGSNQPFTAGSYSKVRPD